MTIKILNPTTVRVTVPVNLPDGSKDSVNLQPRSRVTLALGQTVDAQFLRRNPAIKVHGQEGHTPS